MTGAERPDFDVVVIGGGLAGLTAGLFAARYGCSTLVIETMIPGGHLVNVERIEDVPGFPEGVPGYDLGPMAQEQAERYGAQFRLGEVEGLEAQEGDWRVVVGGEGILTRAVIVASGGRPRALGVPGEERLIGRGISHCATCDGPLFGGRVVGVAGGSDWALQEALTLAGHAAGVIVLCEGPDLGGQESLRRRVDEQPAIEVRRRVTVLEVLGEGTMSGVRLRDGVSGEESQLELAGLFVYAGLIPNTALLEGKLRLAADGRVPTDVRMRTELPGVFAAGDVRQDAAGHAITAAGDGATAAIAAHEYVRGRRAGSDGAT
jgi:thioredoxin reductase (NADPH)